MKVDIIQVESSNEGTRKRGIGRMVIDDALVPRLYEFLVLSDDPDAAVYRVILVKRFCCGARPRVEVSVEFMGNANEGEEQPAAPAGGEGV